MIKTGLRILRIIEDAGFRAYLVGGLPRDHIMGIKTNDIDITTNATPKDLINIFEDAKLPEQDYGSVKIVRNNIPFEIVTFRNEADYDNLRRPTKVEYISSLTEDLKRRDFTINTICMDSEGKIIDLFGGQKDIHNKLIKTLKDPEILFREDPLRILRAIRFATVFDFNLSDDIIKAIPLTRDGLDILSLERIKTELDKMFISSNYLKGIKLLKEFELDKILSLYNLDKVGAGLDLIGIWAIINNPKYIKRSSEKRIIKEINDAVCEDLMDPFILFKHGGYVSVVAGVLNGVDKREMVKRYNDLPIKFKYEMALDGREIEYIKKIAKNEISKYQDILLKAILTNKVNNNKEELTKYLEEL